MITGFTVPISHWGHPSITEDYLKYSTTITRQLNAKLLKKKKKQTPSTSRLPPKNIAKELCNIYICTQVQTSTQSTGPFSIWLTCPIIKMGQLFNFRYVTNIFCHGRWKQKLLFVLSLSARPITSTSGTRIPSLSCRKFSGYYVFMRLSMFRQFTFKTFTNFSLLPPLLPFSNKPQMQLAPTECLQKVLHSVLLRCSIERFHKRKIIII